MHTLRHALEDRVAPTCETVAEVTPCGKLQEAVTLVDRRWTTAAIEAALMQGAWFAGTETDLRRRLLALGRLRRFGAREAIYVMGRPSRGLWAVLQGVATLGRRRGKVLMVFATLEVGCWFGDLAALTHSPAKADAATATEATLLWIPQGDLDRLLEEPRFWRRLAELALERYEILAEMLEQAIAMPPVAHVAARLLTLCRLKASPNGGVAGVTLVLSQLELAEMTGLSRQSVNRCLGELARSGALEVGFRRIVVCDAAALARAAEQRR
jgi:CRP-like cAMP-binding protein